MRRSILISCPTFVLGPALLLGSEVRIIEGSDNRGLDNRGLDNRGWTVILYSKNFLRGPIFAVFTDDHLAVKIKPARY